MAAACRLNRPQASGQETFTQYAHLCVRARARACVCVSLGGCVCIRMKEGMYCVCRQVWVHVCNVRMYVCTYVCKYVCMYESVYVLECSVYSVYS